VNAKLAPVEHCAICRSSSTRFWIPNGTATAAWSPTGGCSRCPNQPTGTYSSISRTGTTPRTCFLRDHPRWSVYWDKKHGLWRVVEDDPDSDLYAESSDVDTVIGYIRAHA
jgi:hypothetical protein